MGVKLQALAEFQDLELQIVDIRRQLERKDKQVQAQLKKLESMRAGIAAERDEIRKSQAQFDETDVDIKGRSGHVTKLREQLNSVRTNKEYAAILQQINSERADMSRVETKALEMMQGLENRKAALLERQKMEQSEVARLEALKVESEQTKQQYSARLAALMKRRDDASGKLDKDTITHFERLSERYDGEAMAELVRPNPRRDEFICGGCNMGVQADRANSLRTKDEIITCKNCGRILFVRTES
jgi:predicted  nucleic acid-binding Zn-ribbon protein